MPSPLDRFIPQPEIRERFQTRVRAPASLVMDTACNLDIQSLPLVQVIFWLRAKLMGARQATPRMAQGLVAETRELGWALLQEEAGRLVVCGAACQPWRADVRFTPISGPDFAAYAEPDRVKIAWTLEAEPVGPNTTVFSHETRVVATDLRARDRFLRYWRWARFGIVAIRLLLLPAVRHRAERRWRAGPDAPAGH